MSKKIKARLEYLRGELRAERISYGEMHELQSMAEHIEPGDTELLEAAGVPEFPQPKPLALTKEAAIHIVYGGLFSFNEPLPTADKVASEIERVTNLREIIQQRDELLAVLSKALQFMEQVAAEHSIGDIKTENLARAAIAKAKGQS